MLPPLDAKIFVLEIFTDGMLSENIQALIQEELLPLINNPTTDDNKFLIEVKTEIVKILQNESILYPNDAVRLFRFINSYFFDKKEDEDWIQCLNQLIQPYQALTTNSIEKMKIFIQKIQKYCIEEAPDHGCSSKEIRKLFEKLFLI